MRIAVGLAMTAIVAGAALYAFSERHTPPLAASTPYVKTMQVNTLAKSGAGIVAGGEQGHIFFTPDEGKSWTASKLPAQQRYAQINAITFADANDGLALAHEGTILHTSDGGKSWEEVFFDKEQGASMNAAAKLPSGQWLAVGAFGTARRTADNGKTWETISFAEGQDRHYNAIIHTADKQHYMILGESGTLLKSDDQGQTWSVIPSFYNGSFYGGLAFDANNWLIYGMRGNVYRTADAGATWTKATVPLTVSTFSHAQTADGALYLFGLGGTILKSTDGGLTFTVVRTGPQPALLDIVPVQNGWLAAAENGVRHYSPDWKMEKEVLSTVPAAGSVSKAGAAQ